MAITRQNVLKIDEEHFKRVLHQKGYTIYRLAKEIGKDQGQLYRKVNNRGDRFNLDDIFPILKVLNIKFDELFLERV